MKKHVLVILALACVPLFSSSLLAEEPKPFSAKELNKFLSDFPGFVSFMNEQEKTVEDASDPTLWEGMQISQRMTDYLQKEGWKPERFFYVVSHVSAGLAAVMMEEQAPMVQAQLAESRKAIQDNPMISPEMKKQLIAQMEQSAVQVRQMDQAGKDLPASELKLIRNNKERIAKTFDAE